ncbi:MAG: hypothetical protein JSV65_07395 [Armatimonadota bacterium]|nr:MAG: hypothetical protein JSV65_07395 [Armatimonadota bacterium]
MLFRHAKDAQLKMGRLVAIIVAVGAVIALPSCGGKSEPVKPIGEWTAYNAEGGDYSMEVPADWTRTERGGAGGFETTVRANRSNWVVVKKQILPGGMEAKLNRSDTREPAIIEAVQGHYGKLESGFEEFRGDAPEVGDAGGAMAGFGSFTCSKKAGFGGGTVDLMGSTVLIFGLNNVYVFDAFADAESADVVTAALERMLDTFKFEE